jgi:hypothetical protein
MKVESHGSEFDVPDLLVSMFLKDFDSLPGSGCRDSICQLRGSIDEILEIVAHDPQVLSLPDCHKDFIRALAMKQALNKLGILYDA